VAARTGAIEAAAIEKGAAEFKVCQPVDGDTAMTRRGRPQSEERGTRHAGKSFGSVSVSLYCGLGGAVPCPLTMLAGVTGVDRWSVNRSTG
jgi:hypothetical protein